MQYDGLFVFQLLFNQKLFHPFCHQLALSSSKEGKVEKTKKHYWEKNSEIKKFFQARKDDH